MKWLLGILAIAPLLSYGQDPIQVRGTDCLRNYRVISASNFLPEPIRAWNLEAMDIFVAPEQLLPSNFLKELQKKGPVVTLLRKARILGEPGIPDGMGVELSIVRGSDVVASVTFSQDAAHPELFYLTDFQVQNPDAENLQRDYITPTAPLPGEASRHFMKQMLEFAQAGGAKRIKIPGPTSYTTLQYARRLGFKPAHKKARETMEMLDEMFKDFKNADFGTFTADFSYALGTHFLLGHEADAHVAFAEAWKQHLDGEVAEPYQLTFNPRGEPLLFEWDRVEDGEPTQYYGIVDYRSSPPRLIEWRQLFNEGRLEMERDLTRR